MSSPDAKDASPSPEYSDHPDDADMAAKKKSNAHFSEGSPGHKSNGRQDDSTPKDPTRPRRKKARRACQSCQRAHLTCGDERPCHRCLKRGLQDSCMDGVRKKAKYLHDAPDGALMPGVSGHYPPNMNGSSSGPPPNRDPAAVAAEQRPYYTEPPSATTFYAHTSAGRHLPSSQDAAFSRPQPPLSPTFRQTAMPNAQPEVSPRQLPALQQFGGPLFDPSDPALFNFDISSLNFGNHYGALELGMLGHMSSGATETQAGDNPLNQAANMFNPPISQPGYGENRGLPAHLSFGPDGLGAAEWPHTHSRHGSLQIKTPHNTPITASQDNASNRHDSLNGPHAYAIGQGPSSLSSASPASTDIHSGYDNDNPLSTTTFFVHTNGQSHANRSPNATRPQQDNRILSGPLQPVQSNAVRRRRPETKSVYQTVTEPYNYVVAFHRLLKLLEARYSEQTYKKALQALHRFRPVLLSNAGHLDAEDLVHAEKNLQRSLISMQESFAEVGTPSLICRRSGEVVGMNKEFEILTGWRKEVLLGREPNLNVNKGDSRKRSDKAEPKNRTSTTPNLLGQEPDSGPHAVNILELMDEPSAVQYLDDFADLAYDDPFGKGHRRVNMLRYQTKEDLARMAERSSSMSSKLPRPEPLVKQEGGSIHQGEAMRHLGANGLIDSMIMWHIKRDNFEMPMLVAMQIMPMLKP